MEKIGVNFFFKYKVSRKRQKFSEFFENLGKNSKILWFLRATRPKISYQKGHNFWIYHRLNTLLGPVSLTNISILCEIGNCIIQSEIMAISIFLYFRKCEEIVYTACQGYFSRNFQSIAPMVMKFSQNA